ncbi:MAG: hypothetical protein JXR96_17395 [Deltaproteobacteria bacterium]|nr:hypothetical protein [Deltaproteobacteria bacterium]
MNRLFFAVCVVFSLCIAGCPPAERPDVGPAVSAGPSAEEQAARELFRARGIEVPETRMTPVEAARAQRLDLALIREAIAEAKAISDADRQRLEGGADSGAGAAPMQADEAPAGGAPRAIPERPAAEPPPPSPSPASIEEKKAEMPAEMKAVMEPKPSPMKEDAVECDKMKRKAEKAEEGEAPRTVLRKVVAQPREAKILVRDEDGKLTPLLGRELRLVAYLEGPRARTVVDAVFENRSSNRLEGTFYFPLPADASPVGFGMFSAAIPIDAARAFERGLSLPRLPEDSSAGGPEAYAPASAGKPGGPDWQRRQEARVVEQKRARQVYEEVVRQQIDPALLEWSGGNTFQARVFPIEPSSLKRVVLVYEQTLPFDGQHLRYTFPLPDRATPHPATARVHLDERGGKPAAVAMGKDARLVVPTGRKLGQWTVWDLVQEGQGGALSVACTPPAGGRQVIQGADPGGLAGRAFFARLRADFDTGAGQPTGRALFVVDSSLSAEDGQAYALQSAMLEAILSRDTSIRDYAIMLFDVRPRWLHAPGWRPNTPENRQASLSELRKVYLEGATHFDGVLADLDRNAAWLTGGEKPPLAFLLSDGQITWGQAQAARLLDRHPAARALRWICYRFGENAVNQDLFDLLTRETAGRTVTVLSAEEVPAAAAAHRKAAAELVGVEVQGAAVADLTVAGAPRLLFPGQDLLVAGRILDAGQGAKLVVKAALAGKPLRYELDLPAGRDGRLAARAFGELYTRRLLALDDPRLDRMIVALSQHYLLANARASLLVLEDERAYEAYAIADEIVDLRDLEKLRRQEEDKRLEKLAGLDLDAAPELARQLVRALADAGEKLAAPLAPQPLLDQPLAGGEQRVQAEIDYRAARKADKMDVMVYDAVARARALAGDTLGAVRALSCTVELRPADAEAARLVGYGLLALGQFEPAAELFERVRLRRPFEGQVYLEEALALDGAGRLAEAARRYEIVLAKSWPRHESEVKTVAGYHYARLLQALLRDRGLPAELGDQIRGRLKLLGTDVGSQEIDYQLTTHWSTDNIDIDLWVIEPDGTRCYYSHRDTALGGKLHWDITDGLGPELYHMRKATTGEYLVLVHYYGNNSPRLAVPTSLLLVCDRDVFGPEDRYTRRFQMRMLPKQDAVLELRRERL